MKKFGITIILSVLSISVFAQIEQDSIPKFGKKNIEQNDYLNSLLKGENVDYSKLPKEVLYPPIQKANLDLLFVNPLRDVSEDVPVSLSESRHPFVNDYDVRGLYQASSNTFITTSSVSQTYPSLGAMRMVNVGANYNVTDWFSVGGGVYATKYNSPLLEGFGYNRHQNAFGINANMNFKLNDRFLLRTFGQYAPNNKKGVIGLSPTTNYGGVLEYKISDKFGVGMGMERELNPFTGKWVNKPIVYPIFYK